MAMRTHADPELADSQIHRYGSRTQVAQSIGCDTFKVTEAQNGARCGTGLQQVIFFTWVTFGPRT